MIFFFLIIYYDHRKREGGLCVTLCITRIKRFYWWDDDTTMLELLRHGLSADNDLYEVICAKNAQEAIDYLERDSLPAGGFLTSGCPTMFGLDLLAKIREFWPHVKVVLMTGPSFPLLN